MTNDEAIKKITHVKYCYAYEGDYEAFDMAIEALSADRPKNMIHIDDVYRLIAGHSNYHGDAILAAFTCLTEGKEVKPVKPLNTPEKPKGKWIDDGDTIICNKCGTAYNRPIFHNGWNYCPNCGTDMM